MLVESPFSCLASAPPTRVDVMRGGRFCRHARTALSGASAVPRYKRRPFSHAQPMARRSLLLLSLVVLAPGCLVTQDPVTYEPVQTPPVITSIGLSPDPREILLVGGDVGVPQFDITASILSEDTDQPVKVSLYVDYGSMNALDQPFRFALPNFPDLPPASLSDGPRKLIGVRWVEGAFPLSLGCHRLTLVVTHAFDAVTGCPKNLNDSSQVSWFFRQCGDGECTPVLDNCPSTEAICPTEPSAASMKDGGN